MYSKLLKEVLVSYDIENNKKRTKLLNQLKDIGMISIQKSVMWGKLLPADIILIKRVLTKELCKDSDKAFILVSKLTQQGHFFGLVPELEVVTEHAIF
jgi:CRISPR-associated protein Cas2